MGDAPTRTVQIGDDSLRLQEFSAFKAFEAMRRAKDIMRVGPEIQRAVTDYVTDYERDNVIEINRAAALHRYGQELAHLTDRDWEASGNMLRVPRSPGSIEIVMAALPVAFDVAQKQSMQLIAVMALTNRELEDADNTSDEAVDELVETRAKQLQHRAKAHQLVLLAAAGVDLLQDQFDEEIREAARPLLRVVEMLGIPIPGQTTEKTEESPPAPDQPQEEAGISRSEPESAPRPTSSTSSPPSTGGPQTSPSTEPAGVGSPSSGG